MTPLILIFAFPPRALDIVDFFRNFTVEVAGVGDICSFAQLDVRHHGNPQVSPGARGAALRGRVSLRGCATSLSRSGCRRDTRRRPRSARRSTARRSCR